MIEGHLRDWKSNCNDCTTRLIVFLDKNVNTVLNWISKYVIVTKQWQDFIKDKWVDKIYIFHWYSIKTHIFFVLSIIEKSPTTMNWFF